MKKAYILKDNQIIIYPGSAHERNLTEEFAECEFCNKAPRNTCGKYNPIVFPACDWFTFSPAKVYVKEE